MMSGDQAMTAVDPGVAANDFAMTAEEFIALKPNLCAACEYFKEDKCRWLDQEDYARALTTADGHHIVSCPWNHQRVQAPCNPVAPPVLPSRFGNSVTRIITMAGEFITAVTGPRVDETTYQRRLAICRTCPHLREEAGHEYCGACGCPQWKLARLSVKLWLAELACPVGGWAAEARLLPDYRVATTIARRQVPLVQLI